MQYKADPDFYSWSKLEHSYRDRKIDVDKGFQNYLHYPLQRSLFGIKIAYTIDAILRQTFMNAVKQLKRGLDFVSSHIIHNPSP
jgi:hypothetical protein